jgi:hypothetical protein
MAIVVTLVAASIAQRRGHEEIAELLRRAEQGSERSSSRSPTLQS